MYERWLKIQTEIKKLTEEKHDIEGSIWLKANEMGQINLQGSKTFDVDGFKVTITHKDNVKVDQEIAAEHPYLFKAKYEYSKELLKNMIDGEKAIVNEAITITPAKPGFKIERV